MDQSSGILDFVALQRQQDLLRFITCGSVDDGKSTLIGRLLWESRQLFDDQMVTLAADSKKYGTQGDNLDFALLVDGLSAEREQGITIDVAYRFFSTTKRKFIVADTPGHEQYTRNMVTGASTADVAVLLVDARHGIQTQTRRHAYLVSLMGVRQVVLAVNKMDLTGFDAGLFRKIEEEFRLFAKPFGFANIVAIPLSALQGDNIIEPSRHTPWYQGPTLMGFLETVSVFQKPAPFAFPVQRVSRPSQDFRGFSGTVAHGYVRLGDGIRVTASGQTAQVEKIVSMGVDGKTMASAGEAVTLCLDREIDISRGDVLTLSNTPIETTDHMEATLVWLGGETGHAGRSYLLKLSTQWVQATVTSVRYKVNVNTLAHEPAKDIAMNDVCVCTLSLAKPVAFSKFEDSRALGGFILVDRFSNATVAAGMIRHSLRRAKNIHFQPTSITRKDRERLNGVSGRVIWFTGLSGSGKSTLANALECALYGSGVRTFLLDGDNVRHGLNNDLGFTNADRVENIRRVAEVSKLMLEAGLTVLTAFISPFRAERDMVRNLVGEENFLEVYVNTPLEICEQRDPKGLYQKARRGEIPNMTGIGSPYEAPEHADIEIDLTDMPLEKAVETIMDRLHP